MNPESSHLFSKWTAGCYITNVTHTPSSFANSTCQQDFIGYTTCKPTQIHVNPKMCAPRNIYINKAFTPSTGTSAPTQKSERVYYNPKFLNSNVNLLLKPQEDLNLNSSLKEGVVKKEPNIYINPNFIKNDGKQINHLKFNSKPIITTQASSAKSTTGSGIYVNPMFLKNMASDSKTDIAVNSKTAPTMIERLNPSISSSLNSPRQRYVSKYKIVRKKLSPAENNSFYLRKIKPSLYKKINQVPIRKKKLKIVKGKFLKYVSQNVIDQRKVKAPVLSEFKIIGLNKLVRKSVLQNQIESRMRARKCIKGSFSSIQKIPTPRKSVDKVSKYKIIRASIQPSNKKTVISNKTVNSKKKPVKRKRSSLVFSSLKYRTDKRKKVEALTKKLRKNNQPCPFYNRYGHCKGKEKGTCQRLHDPKYIAICKRFVKGECKDKNCTLSHDIRPEKMPTCHHYLAGLCKRTDCPYLHIKVNQKAPICRAFLQGFCAEVFNCTKRHEYICPIFAERGSCPREKKSCPYPHRMMTTLSKLLEPDEFPLLNHKHKSHHQPEVSIINQTDSSDTSQLTKKSTVHQPAKESKSKEFRRYFLASLSDSE